jgi:hypothetical protein
MAAAGPARQHARARHRQPKRGRPERERSGDHNRAGGLPFTVLTVTATGVAGTHIWHTYEGDADLGLPPP